MSNPAFTRNATNRFGNRPRGPIPVADTDTPDTIASIVDEVVDTSEAEPTTAAAPLASIETSNVEATADAGSADPEAFTEGDSTEPKASGEDPQTTAAPAATGITPATSTTPVEEDTSADVSESPTATERTDLEPEQATEVTPPAANTPVPDVAQADTPAPPAPAKKAAPKKGARKKAAGTDAAEDVATKPLVVISDGKVHYLDTSVYVVNLDDARAVTDAHEVVDFLAGLAEVADSDGKTDVISKLTEILTEKALSR